ncbi:MAG: hypothetical protein ACKO1W_11705 [Microcystaceae cyanobacterium]
MARGLFFLTNLSFLFDGAFGFLSADIIRQRQIERRRDEIVRDAQEAMAGYRAGNLKPMSAEEAIAELNRYLESDEE